MNINQVNLLLNDIVYVSRGQHVFIIKAMDLQIH